MDEHGHDHQGHGHDSGAFSELFPLPLRILCLITLGIFAWASNLHFLTILGIDVPTVLDIKPSDHGHLSPPLPLSSSTSDSNSNSLRASASEGYFTHPSKLHVPIYQLATMYAAWTALGWLVNTLVTSLHANEDFTKFVPALFAITAVLVIFMPWDRMKKRERFMFLRSVAFVCSACQTWLIKESYRDSSLKRIAFDGLYSTVPFCDVILADVLTSFAKVLGDVWISAGLLIGADTKNRWGGYWGVPLLNR